MSNGKIKVSSLKANPDNPRKWDEKALAKLAKSIEDFPEMMNLRPIVTYKGIVIGGNMRLAAIRYLGMTEIPASWVKAAENLSKEQIKEFLIKDNTNLGDWDIEKLKSIKLNKDTLSLLNIYEEQKTNFDSPYKDLIIEIPSKKFNIVQSFIKTTHIDLTKEDIKTTNQTTSKLIKRLRQWAEQKK